MAATTKRNTVPWCIPAVVLAAILVAPVFTGCGEEEPAFSIDDFETSLKKRKPEREIIADIEEESVPQKKTTGRLRGFLVKDAARIRTKEFLLNYVRESFHDVALGQATVLGILTFTGPSHEGAPPRFLPFDLKEIRLESLHMVQRNLRPGKIRILKDLEIFLVFKKAYDSLSHEDRLSLINGWIEKYGAGEPEEPKDKFYPLFWLRSNPIFWDRGGRFWWWAAHALMRDGCFRIVDDGRVHITLPDGKGMFHS